LKPTCFKLVIVLTRTLPPIPANTETPAPKKQFGQGRATLSIVKLGISIIAAISISACSDSKTSKQQTPNSQQHSDVEGIHAQEIEDSVAAEEPLPTEGSPSAEGSRTAEDSRTAEGSAPSSGRSAEEDTLDNSLSVDSERSSNHKNTQALIEDMGFSEAENEAAQVNLDAHAFQPSCLDSQHTKNPKGVTVEQACKQISNRLASVEFESCKAANLKPTGCFSVDGFPILLSEFPPVKDRIPQGRILIIGGTHGDELTSVSVSMRWIDKLNKYHSGLFHWHMVPMMNPDGVLKAGATRTNGNGVDLNRNMPSDDWGLNALKYWKEKGNKDPRKFPGEQASSEPETRWLINEIERFKPDAIISVHAPYGVVDFDSLLLNTAPKSLGKLHLNLLGTYPGSLGNYAGINRNIPVITLELPHSWVMPSEAETSKIWEDIVSWLKKNIKSEPELASTKKDQH